MISRTLQKLTKRIQPRHLKVLANFWPPFRSMGITIEEMDADYTFIKAKAKLSWKNANFHGAHFGGTLFAIADPFLPFLYIQQMGKEYMVWDKSARIDFIKPGRGTIFADFSITVDEIRELKQRLQQEPSVAFEKEVKITDASGVVVAKVTKEIYIRAKRSSQTTKRAVRRESVC
mgnify:CR=1 FL=1